MDNKPLAGITLDDLQSFADSLTHLRPNSARRKINAMKSLLAFGQKLGYLQFNVGAALNAPKVKNTLTERILTEAEVHSMIALTGKVRDKVLLRLLYASAGRVSEVCALKRRDVRPNGESGPVTLFVKGAQTRWGDPQSMLMRLLAVPCFMSDVWASEESIDNLSFVVGQSFTPFLKVLRCLSHPICYFANDFQRRLGAI